MAARMGGISLKIGAIAAIACIGLAAAGGAADRHYATVAAGIAAVLVVAAAVLLVRDLDRAFETLRRQVDAATAAVGAEAAMSERRDAFGALAAAVAALRRAMAGASEAAKRQEEAGRQQAERSRQEMLAMAGALESRAGETVASITELTSALADRSKVMNQAAADLDQGADAAAGEVDAAVGGADDVARSADGLRRAMAEVVGKVRHSADLARQAAEAAGGTQTVVRELDREAAEIGRIVDIIREIAAQTNLLALNATIEAARAGAAGKGFAVVAGEVKSLAGQTAKATQEIGERISAVQSVSGSVSRAITEVAESIRSAEEIASAVAGAIVEQATATDDIAGGVGRTADAAKRISERMHNLTGHAGATRQSAEAVAQDAGQINETVAGFRTMLTRMLRTSADSANRRAQSRYLVELPARIAASGRDLAATVVDISAGGACVRTSEGLNPGDGITLSLTGGGYSGAAQVVRLGKLGWQLRFVGGGLDEGALNRLAAAGGRNLLSRVEAAHRVFAQRLAEAAAQRTALMPSDVADYHGCRYSLWQDEIADPEILESSLFKELTGTHRATHSIGARILGLVEDGQAEAARKLLPELDKLTATVTGQLSELAGLVGRRAS